MIQPTSAAIQGVTEYQLSLLGQVEIPIRLSAGRAVPIGFLVMQRGATLLGPKAKKQIKLQINVAPAPRDLQNKIAAGKVAKGGFKVMRLKQLSLEERTTAKETSFRHSHYID